MPSTLYPFFTILLAVFLSAECCWGNDTRLFLGDARKRVWYNAYGGFSNLTSDNAQKELSGDEFGLMAGYDRRLGAFAQFGFGLGGDITTAEKKNRSFDLEIPSVKGLFYTKLTGNRWYFDADLGFGSGQYKETHRTAGGEFRITDWKNQWSLGGELGIHWDRGMTKTEPFFSLRRTILDDGLDDNALTMCTVGCRYGWKFSGPLATVKPGFFGGYVHQFEYDLITSGCWVPCATVYRVPDATMVQDRVFLGMNLTLSMRKCLDLYGRFCSDFAAGYSSYSFFAGMNWNF
ncbi:MAG: autotransporter outer membrane beta-barrel domain-containing protein [Planctomycetaceae bacterium]|nr:autotransporter outer membrane beta-barrel domain-containing protein [Planctomycetaceae bacterium]